MNNYSYANSESYRLVKETCPIVRAEIEGMFDGTDVFRENITTGEIKDLLGDIMNIVSKHGTEPLRNMLVQILEEKIEFEGQVSELENQIKQIN